MQDSYELVRSRDGTSWMLPSPASEEDAVADEAIASLALLIQGSAPREDSHGGEGSSGLASSAESIDQLVPAPRPAEAPRAPRRSSLAKPALALVALAALAAVCADGRAWRRAQAAPAAREPSAKLRDGWAPPEHARAEPNAGGAPARARGETAAPPSAWAALRARAPSVCAAKRLGLSLGLGALGLAVGIPYVPGVTDNLFVGLFAGALPIAADLPCGLPQWQLWAGSALGALLPNATALGAEGAGVRAAWGPSWAAW